MTEEGKIKTVPESDLIRFKKSAEERERKYKADIKELNERIAQMASEVKVAKLDADDDEEVAKVRKYLLERETELNEKESKHEADLTAFKGREKAVRAKELAAELKQKGLDVKDEDLTEAEDMEALAHTRYVEFLAKENEELKKKSSPEVFEANNEGKVTKSVKEMDDKEFDSFLTKQKQEALAKR